MTHHLARASLNAGAGGSAPTDALEALTHRLLGQVGRASRDFGLLEPGDHVLVAISGGKDSYTMLDLLRQLQRRAPFPFSLVAVNIDQGHPGYPRHVLEDYLAREGYPAEFVIEDTYSVVKEKVPEGKTYCSLCSRLRRGILYTTATRLGANKIALGHHREDLTETLLLNLFYAGQIKSMPPRLVSDDGAHVVIRPLCYSAEEDIAEYARLRAYPILPCDLCGSQENLKRKRVKQLISDLHAENPNVRGNLFAALGNVRTSHLLPEKESALLGEGRLRVVSEP
ncbi:MAG TPA: tRNA 2-thiocytidine(32) synthetase TtcA [Polyangiaceae bacterium]|nr:tRNA 2-thiocytidine(32) synthetase TtcA [Polyangiaceae bacterium]